MASPDGKLSLSVESGGRGTLGPLSVEIYSGEGDTVADFALNSQRPSHSLDLDPGHYTVVARRPNGGRLRQSVKLDSNQQTVFLDQSIGDSPNEFLSAETLRGEVKRAVAAMFVEPAGAHASIAAVGALAGVASATLRTAMDLRRQKPDHRQASSRGDRIVVWGDAGKVTVVDFTGPSSFLKLRIANPCGVRAVGLLDDRGIGPIVMVPPFRQGIDISFIAESLNGRPVGREANPSAARTPVAVVLPAHSAVADMLSAMAAQSFDHAEATLQDNLAGIVNVSGGTARDILFEKFDAPAEAALAAHYLLRFMPQMLPPRWADNLCDALPDAADGPVIAAWARLSQGVERDASASAEANDSAFEQRIRLALSRPRILFARARRLLGDAIRLLPKLRSELPSPSPGDFLDFGAQAGGLESFWGSGPETPGLKPRSAGDGAVSIARVRHENGAFTAVEFHPLEKG